MKPENLTEVVLTGGPCAGKTTVLSLIRDSLSRDGLRVLTSPEVASFLIGGGISDINKISHEDPHLYEQIEAGVMLIQGDLRKRYRRLAEAFSPVPVIVIYDRAEMDAVSYLEADRADIILRQHGSSIEQARETYDGVVCLRTAARLGLDHYRLDNPARREDAAEALVSDQNTLDAWIGHPKLWVVEASDDFETKVQQVKMIIERIAGLQKAHLRTFSLVCRPTGGDLSQMTRAEIRRYRLRSSEGALIDISSRRCGDSSSFSMKLGDLDRNIGADKFTALRREASAENETSIDRYHFVFSSRSFHLDQSHDDGSWTLVTETLTPGETIDLPDFLDIGDEVRS